MVCSDMTIAAMLKRNKTELMALQEKISAYEERCKELEEVNKQIQKNNS